MKVVGLIISQIDESRSGSDSLQYLDLGEVRLTPSGAARIESYTDDRSDIFAALTLGIEARDHTTVQPEDGEKFLDAVRVYFGRATYFKTKPIWDTSSDQPAL